MGNTTADKDEINRKSLEEEVKKAIKELEELAGEKVENQGREASQIQLTVEDAHMRDVGRGIARINQKTIQKLGISAGDVIEVSGKRTTAAIAWPAYSEDQDRDIIRIDGFTRKNAGVAIKEYVVVRLANVKDATRVTLAPIDMRLVVDEDFTNFVKMRLMERTFVEGDTTLVMMLGQTIPFTVVKTSPDGIVKVTYETSFQILSEPLEVWRQLTLKEKEEKMLSRFAWLKAIERKCASEYVKFCIPEWNIEADKEGDALFEAENIVKNKKVPVTIFIELWEKRGKISSLPWAKVDLDGTREYIYPEDLLKVCLLCGEPVSSYYGRYYCYKCSRYV